MSHLDVEVTHVFCWMVLHQMEKGYFVKVKVSKGDEAVGYVCLPVKSKREIIKIIDLHGLIKGHKDIPAYLDINEKMKLVGIEN